MTFTEDGSDKASLSELGARIARYRLNRNLTQAALAQEAGVSLRTLVRMEQGESVQLTNLVRMLRALGLLGNLDTLVPAPAPSPLQQLKMQGKVRKRASNQVEPGDGRDGGSEPKESWSWGSES